jgi:hypothetical protein
MKSLFRLLVLVLLIGGWALAALGLHVVVAPPTASGNSLPARIVLLPKDRLGLDDTYVDTRQWTLNDAARHPTIVKRLLATGKADVLGHLVKQDPRGMSVEAILADAVARGPQEESPTSAPTTATSAPSKNDSLAQHASARASPSKATRRAGR